MNRNSFVFNLALLLAVLLLVSCGSGTPMSNSTEDFTGGWRLSVDFPGDTDLYIPLVMTQRKEKISIEYLCDPALTGTGSAIGPYVDINIEYNCLNLSCSGERSDARIDGNWSGGGYSGTWEASNAFSLSCSNGPIQTASITVDGNTLDWNGVIQKISDNSFDADSTSGSDLEKIYIAKDSSNMFIRIDLSNGSPANDLYYKVSFYSTYFPKAGDSFVLIDMSSNSVSVEEVDTDCGTSHAYVDSGKMVVSGSTIELSVPLSSLNLPSRSFTRAWSNKGGFAIDSTRNAILPLN